MNNCRPLHTELWGERSFDRATQKHLRVLGLNHIPAWGLKALGFNGFKVWGTGLAKSYHTPGTDQGFGDLV